MSPPTFDDALSDLIDEQYTEYQESLAQGTCPSPVEPTPIEYAEFNAWFAKETDLRQKYYKK